MTTSTLNQQSESGNGKLYDTGDDKICVLQLSGSWFEMGQQYGALKENGGATKPSKQDADLTNYQVVSDLSNLEVWLKLPALNTEWRHVDLKPLFN